MALSPTQRLLRKKAAAAWRAEVLRQALAAIPAPRTPETFLALNPDDEMACRVHILTSDPDPMELEGGDIGLIIEELATLQYVKPRFPRPPPLPPRPLAMAPMIDKTPLNARKRFGYVLVPTTELKSPEEEALPVRRRSSFTTRRALAVAGLFCIIVLIHALNMALELSWRSPESP